MLVVPTDSDPFKWSEIHVLAKAKLEALDRTIRKEIQSRPEPLPANGGARHQFFVLLSERVDDWATRAKTAYLDCLTQIGRAPSRDIEQSIWENGLKFFIVENLRRYMILACEITTQELEWAEEGSAGVRGTPRVRAVLSTLNEINRIIQSVRDRFQASLNRSGGWLSDARRLLQTMPAAHREDTFVTGRAPAILTEIRDPGHPPLQVFTESIAADKEGVLFGSADETPWQQFADDFSKLTKEEKTASASPLGVMAFPQADLSSDLEDWKTHEGYSENFRARFELLALKAGNALGPFPSGSSPFGYWLHKLYQHLCENRSSLKGHFISGNPSGVEVPFVHNACEASSTFCLRLQKRALESYQGKPALSACFQDWIENNFVNESIPPQVSERNRISIVAKNASNPIPIHFLSSRLQGINLPRGSTENGSPSKLFDRIAERHGLIWVITRQGLWMAQKPPSAGEFIDAFGREHGGPVARESAVLIEGSSTVKFDQAVPEPHEPTRREMIDSFMQTILGERGIKISRTDINRVAGYKDRRQIEKWQSGESKSGTAPDLNFNRVLSLDPDEFLRRLKIAKAPSSR